MVSTSPTLAVAGTVTLTESVVAAPCSAALIRALLSASVVMTTVGATEAVVSMVTGTVAEVVLPAGSVSRTATFCGPPSGQACTGVTLHLPAASTVVEITSPVGMVTWMVLPGSPVPEMVGVVSLVVLSPWVPESDAGSSTAVRAGAVVSALALSVPISPRLPAASLTCASTLRVASLAGVGTPVRVTLLALMSAWVSSLGAWATPLM